MKQVIPPQKLLFYNWSDGWAPLAHFLERPIPEEESPHVDGVKFEAAVKPPSVTSLDLSDETKKDGSAAVGLRWFE